MPDDLVQRDEAEHVRHAHDPANQSHSYDRCKLCGYTHHPCDVWSLADTVIAQIDRIEALEVRNRALEAEIARLSGRGGGSSEPAPRPGKRPWGTWTDAPRVNVDDL